MQINNNIKFDFDDILIQPSKITNIKSRYEDINPYYESEKNLKKLPIMTAPMDTVVDLDNMQEYIENDFIVVLPRTVTIYDYFNYIKINNKHVSGLFPDFTFMSFSLHDFKFHYTDKNHIEKYKDTISLPNYVLIDIANGHLTSILDTVKKAKKINPNLVVIVGNIANPETYRWYAESGVVDYIRIGVGNGGGCLTTQQTGIGYPKASLIAECRAIKNELESMDIKCPAIIADGGMKDYSDIIKALAIGADYVMVGSIFNKALESAGDNYLYGRKISKKNAELLHGILPIKKKFYGMSTKEAQKKLGARKLKTSEGVVRYRNIEYKLHKWHDNFSHYLRSAMSYTNARNLNDFIGQVEYNFISQNALNRFKK